MSWLAPIAWFGFLFLRKRAWFSLKVVISVKITFYLHVGVLCLLMFEWSVFFIKYHGNIYYLEGANICQNKMNDGDWICSDANCGNINFARRNSCYRCNKERPNGKPYKKKLGTEIGKSAAEKSRGLFNADDWQCNKCANVNWARRQTCNVCNAPKFGEVCITILFIYFLSIINLIINT